ncbi:MAG: PKD domain-containing protein, partial [Pseudomonadota bacterium]|nr:PKD domain-containing protein [Pseudomonadota bacterium]
MYRIVVLCVFVGVLGSVAAQAAVCDIDADGNVDRADIELIFAARNTQASGAQDLRDADGDGLITVSDARRCTLRCALPSCALVDANAAPVAVAGTDRTVAVGESVQLDGSGSHDADANALAPRWSFTALPQDSQAVLIDPNG